MAYDESKDKLIEDLGPVPGTDLTAEIRQYDEGATKIAFIRHFEKKDGTVGSRRLFSIATDQAQYIGALLMSFAPVQEEPEEAEEEEDSGVEEGGEPEVRF